MRKPQTKTTKRTTRPVAAKKPAVKKKAAAKKPAARRRFKFEYDTHLVPSSGGVIIAIAGHSFSEWGFHREKTYPVQVIYGWVAARHHYEYAIEIGCRGPYRPKDLLGGLGEAMANKYIDMDMKHATEIIAWYRAAVRTLAPICDILNKTSARDDNNNR